MVMSTMRTASDPADRAAGFRPRARAGGAAVARRARAASPRARRARRRTNGSTRRASSTTPTRCRRKRSTRRNVELDKQGMTGQADRTGAHARAAPRQGEQEDERQKQLAKEQEEIERRDRALLSIVHERERDRPRAQPRAADDRQRRSSRRRAYTTQLTKRKADARGEEGRLGDKPVAAGLERELASIDTELARAGRTHRAEAEGSWRRSRAKYDADKQRWRELVAAKADGRNAGATRRPQRHRRRARHVAAPPRSSGALARARAAGRALPLARRSGRGPACDNRGLSFRQPGSPWLNTFTR